MLGYAPLPSPPLRTAMHSFGTDIKSRLLRRTCTNCSLSVSRRTAEKFWTLPRILQAYLRISPIAAQMVRTEHH